MAGKIGASHSDLGTCQILSSACFGFSTDEDTPVFGSVRNDNQEDMMPYPSASDSITNPTKNLSFQLTYVFDYWVELVVSFVKSFLALSPPNVVSSINEGSFGHDNFLEIDNGDILRIDSV
jgi:hypothetical protein